MILMISAFSLNCFLFETVEQLHVFKYVKLLPDSLYSHKCTQLKILMDF